MALVLLRKVLTAFSQKWTITPEENEALMLEVERTLLGSYSETDAALDRYRRDGRPYRLSTENTSESKRKGRGRAAQISARMLNTRYERRRREKIPAALRQLPHACHPKRLPLTMPQLTQITPVHFGVRSGYPYPGWLDEYGITQEDWRAFVIAFSRVTCLTPIQTAIVLVVILFIDGCALGALFPTKICGVFGLPTLPLILHFKRKNLKRSVRDGTIPTWTAYWNKTFFGPKGLCIGFDRPGPVFIDAQVEPKHHVTPWMRL